MVLFFLFGGTTFTSKKHGDMSGKRVSPKMFESFVSLDVVGLTLTVLRASVWMFFV